MDHYIHLHTPLHFGTLFTWFFLLKSCNRIVLLCNLLWWCEVCCRYCSISFSLESPIDLMYWKNVTTCHALPHFLQMLAQYLFTFNIVFLEFSFSDRTTVKKRSEMRVDFSHSNNTLSYLGIVSSFCERSVLCV